MLTIHTQREAKKRPSEHIFVPGVGYAVAGTITPRIGQKTVFGIAPRDLCDAPPGTRDESWHVLSPPGGHRPIAFQWLTGPREWYRLERHTTARRIGFSPAYLSSHGWRYLRPARGRHG